MKTRRTLRAALAALLIAAPTAALAACGSDSSSSTTPTASKAAGNPTDRAFVAEMLPHHRSAVAMAEIAQAEGTSPFVKKLAADIIRTQNSEIGQMQRADAALAEAGVKPGRLGVDSHTMGMDMDAASLKGAKPFDAKFIRMMVPHHTGAIAMARIELAKGSSPQLKALAGDIIAAQQREVTQMGAQLENAPAA